MVTVRRQQNVKPKFFQLDIICKIRIGMLFMSRMVSISFGVNFYRSRLLRQGKLLFLGRISRRFNVTTSYYS